MKKVIPAAVALAFTALSSVALAQAQPQDPSNPMREGQSPRCDALSGDAREQCMKDEGAKTEDKKDEASSSAGSSSAPAVSSSPTDASKPETPSATETPPTTDTAK